MGLSGLCRWARNLSRPRGSQCWPLRYGQALGFGLAVVRPDRPPNQMEAKRQTRMGWVMVRSHWALMLHSAGSESSMAFHSSLLLLISSIHKMYSLASEAKIFAKLLLLIDDDLNWTNITAYIDDGIRRGETVVSALFKAIEESRISSEDFASSSWCLDELSKILESKERNGQIVMPLFYKIDPSDLRHQIKSFKKVLAKLKKGFRSKRKFGAGTTRHLQYRFYAGKS